MAAKGRVGPGITPRASHRSGRAQLRHPVRPVMDSPAAVLSVVVALTRYRDSMLPAGSPRHGSRTSISLPSPGSLRSRFPRFNGTMEMCDFLHPSRRARLPSLGDTMRRDLCFAPGGPGHPTAGQGFDSGPLDRT